MKSEEWSCDAGDRLYHCLDPRDLRVYKFMAYDSAMYHESLITMLCWLCVSSILDLEALLRQSRRLP